MPRPEPLQVRYGRLHNIGMAAVALAMMAVAATHFVLDPANAPSLSLNDPRFVMFFMLALAMGYYVFVGVNRMLNREPQVVIDREGIWLGFGRQRRLAWDDIKTLRLRRLGFRPQLEIGLSDQAFLEAGLRLSMWGLDDSLRPVRGQPTSVLVRDNGLDTPATAMLDAARAFRPNLAKT
ncbi:MAG: hypothetical protein ACOY4R_01845 [Pseudomonadota bacterium]